MTGAKCNDGRVNQHDNTFNNGSLGSCIDEERSQVRNVVQTACSASHLVFERKWHCHVEWQYARLRATWTIASGRGRRCQCPPSSSIDQLSINQSIDRSTLDHESGRERERELRERERGRGTLGQEDACAWCVAQECAQRDNGGGETQAVGGGGDGVVVVPLVDWLID
jgi:hypothetical protein